MGLPRDIIIAYVIGLAGLILVSTLKLAVAPVFTSSFNGMFFALAILLAAGMGGAGWASRGGEECGDAGGTAGERERTRQTWPDVPALCRSKG